MRKARSGRITAVVLFVLFGLPMIIGVVAAALAGEWAVALIVGSLVAVPTVAIWGHLRYSRIVVTPHEIAVLGFVVRRRRPRGQAARVVRADVVQPRVPVVDTVYVLDAAGRVVIRIHGNHYRRADIDRLVAFLGLPWSGPDRPVTAYELSTAHPGIVHWHEAHPFRFGAYAAAVTVVAVVVASLILSVALSPM